MTGQPRPGSTRRSSPPAVDPRDDDNSEQASASDGLGPRLWQRVRRWLHRSLGSRVPRPMPILLEDLYPPPARAVYRSIRAWEQSLGGALDDLGRQATASSILDSHQARRLAARTRALARVLRRYLLRVQRLRYLVASSHLDADHLHAVWKQHRIAWNGELAGAIERLTRVSAPFTGHELLPGTSSPLDARAVELLDATLDEVERDVGERLAALHQVLRADEGSAQRSS